MHVSLNSPTDHKASLISISPGISRARWFYVLLLPIETLKDQPNGLLQLIYYFTMTLLTGVVDLVLESKRFLCLSVFSLFIVVFAAQTIQTWYRLRHFKGPFWAAFSKWWLVRHVVGGGTFHLDVYDVCRRYGML
jgi:hypothetical protein